MREIKFRAWDKRRGRFHGACSNVCLDLSGRLMWQFGYNAPDMLSLDEVENFDLQQYTGLKDKNGKEIYEGDVVDNGSGIKAEITYNDGAFQWGAAPLWVVKHIPNTFHFEFHEVIGNIYEHGDLLNGK